MNDEAEVNEVGQDPLGQKRAPGELNTGQPLVRRVRGASGHRPRIFSPHETLEDPEVPASSSSDPAPSKPELSEE